MVLGTVLVLGPVDGSGCTGGDPGGGSGSSGVVVLGMVLLGMVLAV